MLKLKFQYFGYLMQRADSLEKTLIPGKIEGRKRRRQQGWDGWMASPILWAWVWASSGCWWWTGRPGVLQSVVSQKVRHDWATELNCTALGRKAVTNLKSRLQSRDITLPTKVHLVKANGFSSSHVWMWELDCKESCHRRIDAFELWCLEKTLEGSLDRKFKGVNLKRKSVLNIHWKDWCWSWSSNTLATWYEELTHLKRPWHWERLKAGGVGDVRGWEGCMTSLIQWAWVWFSSRSWWWTGKPGLLQSMGLQIRTWLSDWTELNVLSHDHCS